MGAGSPGGDFRGFSYVLAPQGVRPGDHISTGPTSTIRPGNTLPLSAMPIGQEVGRHLPMICVQCKGASSANLRAGEMRWLCLQGHNACGHVCTDMLRS